jgi:hypothetical protein
MIMIKINLCYYYFYLRRYASNVYQLKYIYLKLIHITYTDGWIYM